MAIQKKPSNQKIRNLRQGRFPLFSVSLSFLILNYCGNLLEIKRIT